MQAQAAYDELIRRTREESLLSSCTELLGWDEETYMPPGGAGHRGSQLALLAGMSHGWTTDPRIGELLGEVEGSPLVADPLSPAAVNVRVLRRRHDRLRRIPRRLIEETAQLTALAQQEWLAARQNADFRRFAPWLERIVVLKRRTAETIGYEDTPYDALLDEYEPGVRTRELVELFDALRRELRPLAEALTHTERRPNVAILRRSFPIARQRTLGEMVIAELGFDFQRGRLDTAAHPFFSAIGPADYRITIRFDAHHFSDGFFSTLHELGHAFYEQGLDPKHYGTPMGETLSVGVHESQSRLWENLVGRQRGFWQHFFPLARQVFHAALGTVTLDDFCFAINNVEASLNRVLADEVTYNLHILARFDLERALITGDLPIADVPGAWNEAYRHYLGIMPQNDREGCLQDGHWSAGMIGYFPTYTLGNIYAAQLFAQANVELGDLGRQFARGEFSALLGWLREKVYRHGSRYTAADLIEQATGARPSHGPLMQLLRLKFGELYGIE